MCVIDSSSTRPAPDKEQLEWWEFLRQHGHWAWGGRETGPRTAEEIQKEVAEIAELRTLFDSRQKGGWDKVSSISSNPPYCSPGSHKCF